MRPALLVAAWTVCASLVAVAGLTRPNELYVPPGQQIALLPDATMMGIIVDALQGVDSAEACAEQCRAALPACSFFAYCRSGQGGCETQTYGTLQQGECLILNRNCTLPADRELSTIGVVSGFPIHTYPPPVVSAFPTFLTQAIVGGDFECPRSEAPPLCAFSNPTNALFNCYRMPDVCVAVTIYANGTNGCSDKPLAVLKNQVPTNDNSFVSAITYTVALTEAQKALRTVLMFGDEAELDLPSDAEILASGADDPASLAYKGCQVGRGFLYHGDVVGLRDGVASAQDCCRLCSAANVAASSRVCTVFNYCGRPGGCAYTSTRDTAVSVALKQGQCELRYQPLASSITSLPPTLLAAGAGVPFEAGAPNALWAPEVPGYTRLPGESIALSGAFECQGSLRPETGECVLPGTLQEAADYCTRTEQCLTFAYRPAPPTNGTNATQPGGATPMLSSFKGKLDNRIVFPTGVLYIKEAAANSSGSGGRTSSSGTSSGGGGGGGGLSAGAIAGIAVGAAAAAAAAAGAAWLLLTRRQRRRQQAAVKGSDETAAPHSAGTGDSGASGDGLRATGSAVETGGSGSVQLSGGRSRASAELPELVQHVAAHEAALLAPHSLSPQASGAVGWDDSMLLPPHLQEWVVDASQLTYLRRADGSLWQIGSGASSRVFRVEYRGEVLAAKEVELGVSQSLRETFVTEASMLHKLRHPNVVSFAGVTFRAPSKGVVLMELCEGRDLHSALQVLAAGSNERLFGWHRRGKRVALEVAKAVNFLHQNRVVHMDIKSPNILLTTSGTAKLADCGFSKVKHDSFLSSFSHIGTFAWAAPELLLGTERPTAAVDIYSLGVVLWEIICGEQPQRGRLRLPRDDECPEEVRTLMLACLSEKPSARPTALQVLQCLRTVVECGSPPPGPASAAAGGGAAGAPPGRPSAAGSAAGAPPGPPLPPSPFS